MKSHGEIIESFEGEYIIDFRECLLIAICCIVPLLGFTEIVRINVGGMGSARGGTMEEGARGKLPYHGERRIDNRYIV